MNNTTIWIGVGLFALYLFAQKKQDVVVVIPDNTTGTNPLTNTGTIKPPVGTVPAGNLSTTTIVPSVKNG